MKWPFFLRSQAADMKVIIESSAFEPYTLLRDYQATLPRGKHGAAVSFVGTMRDINECMDVTSMFLEHYSGMTERQIEEVCQEAMDKWPIQDILVAHRCGELKPDDPIVLVAVWSVHRSEAFDACRYVINYLKQRAPFWKREESEQGQRWVEKNTEDSSA